MDLGFLGSSQDAIKQAKENPVVDIKYDKDKADLQELEIYPIPLTLPYIQRATEYAKSFHYKTCFGLKTALINRANDIKVLTIREADICLRRKLDLDNQFLKSLVKDFNSFLSEDDEYFTEGVFDTRIRYNKGLQWRKNARPTATLEAQVAGDRRIATLDNMLTIFGLPLHEEERTTGLHQEFCKPEYLSWEQFNSRYQEFIKAKSVATKLRIQEVEQVAQELIGV